MLSNVCRRTVGLMQLDSRNSHHQPPMCEGRPQQWADPATCWASCMIGSNQQTCFEQLGAGEAALPGLQQLQALPIGHSCKVSLCRLLQGLGGRSELDPVAHGLCVPGGCGWGRHSRGRAVECGPVTCNHTSCKEYEACCTGCARSMWTKLI